MLQPSQRELDDDAPPPDDPEPALTPPAEPQATLDWAPRATGLAVPKDVPERPQELQVASRARQLAEEVLAIPVPANQEEYERLKLVLDVIATIEDAVHAELDEIISDAHALHKKLCARRDTHLKPLREAKEHVALIGGQFRLNERRRLEAVAVERQAQERSARVAQAEQQAGELRAAGDPELAQAVLEQAQQEAPLGIPKVATTKVKGLAETEEWYFEVVNRELIPDEYWIVDERSLQAVVTRQKSACRIPGIVVRSRPKVRRTGR